MMIRTVYLRLDRINKKAEITIGGSSDPNKPQQGTVRIDEARNGKPYTVIGSASGGGTVSIEGECSA